MFVSDTLFLPCEVDISSLNITASMMAVWISIGQIQLDTTLGLQ